MSSEDNTESYEPKSQGSDNLHVLESQDVTSGLHGKEISHYSSSEAASPEVSACSTNDTNTSPEVLAPENNECDKGEMTGKVTDESFKTPPGRGQMIQGADKCLEEDGKSDLEYISRQLSILNEESGELTTPIHKSNKQKLQELAKKSREMAAKRTQSQYKSPAKRFVKLQGRGVKRSPGKPNMLRIPKRKKLALGEKTPEKGEKPVVDDESDDSDDSSDEKWQILEDSETEIDKVLEENAQKNKLTALNVKNILHQVITNEHVVAMVRNTLLSEAGEEQEATFEPKMTRSKFKQTIEETGDLLHPWPLTPLKQHKPKEKSFLDMELTDEEEDSDVDYNPEKDRESLSDEDSESVASSQLSDIGSPASTTPATPVTSSKLSDVDITPSTDTGRQQAPYSPMGPPSRPLSRKQSLGRKYQEAMAANDRIEEQQTIALRTRSKLSLEDTSILELESSFVPPDFNPEMYETECDDADWKAFLASFWNPPENENTNDGIDDEENDPEYNYLAEAEGKEKAKDVKDEFRSDRAVKISKREMNKLMDELFDYYQETENLEEQQRKEMKTKAKTQIKKLKSEVISSSTPCHIMSEYEREQLEDQMRKHVQLLTQMYILAQSNQKDYTTIAEISKSFLKELHKFKEINIQHMTPVTAYNACNLEAAIELVDREEDWQQLDSNKKYTAHVSPEKSIATMLVKKYSSLSRKKKDLILDIVGNPEDKTSEKPSISSRHHLPPLTKQQRTIFFESPVFIYPEFLPLGGFMFKKDLTQGPKSRITFTEAEDNLIALGLEQFRSLPYYTKLIQKFLLPCKTHEQIKIRIKNLGCAKAPPNAVKYLKQMGHLPEFPRNIGVFNDQSKRPPSEQEFKKLPVWCKEMKIQEIIKAPDEELERNETIQRSQSVPIISGEKTQKIDEKSNSAPATPMTQVTVITPSPSPVVAVRQILPDDPDSDTECSRDECTSTDTGAGNSQSTDKGLNKLMEGICRPLESSSVITPRTSSITPQKSSSSTNQQSFSTPTQSFVSKTKELAEEDTPIVKCNSPGFIPIHENISASPHQQTKINIRIVDKEIISRNLQTTEEGKIDSPVPRIEQESKVQSGDVRDEEASENLQEEEEESDMEADSVVDDSDRDEVIQTGTQSRGSTDEVCMPDVTLGSLGSVTNSVDKDNTAVLNSGSEIVTGKTVSQASVLVSISSTMTTAGQISSTACPSSVSTNIVPSSASCLTSGTSPEMCLQSTPVKDSEKKITPSKSAIDIVASFASYVFSAEKSPVKFQTLAQKAQETTPVKNTPPRYRPLAPKPYIAPIGPPPCIFEKKSPRKSPRRRQLQQKAQAICPKGLVIRTVVSPSKKAASNIVIRALRRGNRKILPRPVDMSMKTRSYTKLEQLKQQETRDETETEDDGMDTVSENDTEFMSDGNTEETNMERNKERKSTKRNQQKKCRKKRVKEYRKRIESDDTQSETEDTNLYDSQTEEDTDDKDHMARLMAASTTIGFAPKKLSSKETCSKDHRSKTEKRKDATLAMLAPDLVDTDPQKDDRDTAFAQAYLAKAKEVLEFDSEVYELFLRLLYEFGKSDQSPVKLYKDLTLLLASYPDLVHDFSGFLLPEQAVECGCFIENQEFKRARTFLRKLEIHFERHPANYQKVMKILSTWPQNKDYKKMREALEPMLKGQPHLLEEFSLFFDDEKPPDSYMTDFEEITLDDSFDEDTMEYDGFEELEPPEEEEITGTKHCKCVCHNDEQLVNYHKRNRHCHSCCLKVIDGELYYRINSKVLKKVKVTYHEAIRAKDITSTSKPELTPSVWEEDEGAEKENQQVIEHGKPKHMGIKLKISQKKKGKQGRFFTINEMVESPVKKDDKSKNPTPPPLGTGSSASKSGLPQNLPDLIPSQDKNDKSVSESHTEDQDVQSIASSIESRLSDKSSPSEVPSQTTSVDKCVNSEKEREDIDESGVGSTGSGKHVSSIRSGNTDSTGSGSPDNSTGSGNPDNSTGSGNPDNSTGSGNHDGGAGNSNPDNSTGSGNQDGGTGNSNPDSSTGSGDPISKKSNNSEIFTTRTFSSPSKESSCADILAKAMKEAMIGQSDVSMDTLFSGASVSNAPRLISPSPSKKGALSFMGISSLISGYDKECGQYSNKSDCDNNTQPLKQSDTPVKTGSPGNSGTKCVKGGTNKPGEKRRITPQPVPDEQVCTSPAFALPEAEDTRTKHSPLTSAFAVFKSSRSAQENTTSKDLTSSSDDTGKASKSRNSCSEQNKSPDLSERRDKNNSETLQLPSSSKIAISDMDTSSEDCELKHIFSPSQNSNLSVNSDTSRTIISSVIGFGTESDNVIKQSATGDEKQNSSGSKEGVRASKERGVTPNSPLEKGSASCDCSWSREDDKIILEKVKLYGPGSSTFEKIATELTGKSATQVSQRFHKLLEMLAEEETPSEEDAEDDKSSS